MTVLLKSYTSAFLNAFRADPVGGRLLVPCLSQTVAGGDVSVSSVPFDSLSQSQFKEGAPGSLAPIEGLVEEVKKRRYVRIADENGEWKGSVSPSRQQAFFNHPHGLRELSLTANDHWRVFVEVGSEKIGWGKRSMAQGRGYGATGFTGIRYELGFYGPGHDALLDLLGVPKPAQDHKALVRSLMVLLGWDATIDPLYEDRDFRYAGPAYRISGPSGEGEILFLLGQDRFDAVSLFLNPSQRSAALGAGGLTLWRLAANEAGARLGQG